MKKTNFLTNLMIFCLLASTTVLKAQQDGLAQSTQYMVNPFLINPALSSSEDFLDIKTGYRTQWVGLDGAPSNMYVSGLMPLNKPHVAQTHPGDYKHAWHGVGFYMYQQAAGPLKDQSIYGNYSFNLKISEGKGFNTYHKDGIRLSVGTFIGVKKQYWDRDMLSKIKVPGQTVTYEYLNNLDINNVGKSYTVMDASFGAMLYQQDVFQLGFSSFQILGSALKVGEKTNLSRHYYLYGSFKAAAGDRFYVIPSFLYKKSGANPFVLDLSCRVDYDDRFFGGMTFRTQGYGGKQQAQNLESVDLMVGTLIEFKEKIKHFRKGKHRYGVEVFYAYDITATSMSQFNKGSHEIILGFRLPPMYTERIAESLWK